MNKKQWCVILLVAVAVVSVMRPGTAKASTFHAGRTILDVLDIKEEDLYTWLVNHDGTTENDTGKKDNTDYYLGSLYVGGDHREPHGDTRHAYGYKDIKGVEALNCTGFVWHVMYKASGMKWRDAVKKIPNVTSTYWDDLLEKNDVEYYEYKGTDAVEKALAGGHLEKGDILALYGTEDEHVGFFWGDTSSENKFWHSLGKKNRISKIEWCGKLKKLRIFKTYAFTKHMERPYADNIREYYRNRDTDRLIFVKYKGGTKAVLSMYKKINEEGKSGKWEKILTTKAYVGYHGIDKKKEGDLKTPTGIYDIDLAFGIKPDPGTAGIRYVKVNKYNYWSDDDKTYDTLVDIRKLDYEPSEKFFEDSEHLVDYPVQYDYALHIAYNKGYMKGSALFVHALKEGQTSTAGCVAMPLAADKKVVQNTTRHTKIVIYR